MAAEETADATTPSESSKSSEGGGKGTIILILTAVNLAVTFGIVGLVVVSFQKEKSKPVIEDIAMQGKADDTATEEGHGEFQKAAKKKTGEVSLGKVVELDKFTVNLSTVGSVAPKYVIVNVSIEVANEDAESEINQKMAQVRNTIIDLFNSKRPADMATVDGRNYLKDEIKNALNSFMVTGKVMGVFFTNFAISS